MGRRMLPCLAGMPPVRLALAYGSRAVPQTGAPPSDVLDLLLVVDDAREWHDANLRSNAAHYTALPRVLGSAFVKFLAEDVGGTGVFFNTMVPLPERTAKQVNARYMKYGVVERPSFVNDLLTWEHCYVAGRLHKPVVTVASDGEDGVETACMEFNRDAALAAALLQLPRTFRTGDLLRTVVGLSYNGDPRMHVPLVERGTKVADVASGNEAKLLGLYGSADARPEIFRRAKLERSPNGDEWTWDATPETEAALVMCLPQNVLLQLSTGVRESAMAYGTGGAGTEVAKATREWSYALSGAAPHTFPPATRALFPQAPSDDAVAASAKAARSLAITTGVNRKAGPLVRDAVARIVKQSAASATFANALSSGLRWAPYIWRKVAKRR